MVTQEDMPHSLDKITGYLLAVETLINDKALLMKKLQEKQVKWEENDQIFKERKITIGTGLKVAMEVLSDLSRQEAANHLGMLQKINQHEKALFMIDQIFIRNRTRSVHFMAQVQELIDIKKDTLNDLGQT